VACAAAPCHPSVNVSRDLFLGGGLRYFTLSQGIEFLKEALVERTASFINQEKIYYDENA
jgi:hypothetical protein